MDKKLETALNNVETTYGELVDIANGMLNPMFEPIMRCQLIKFVTIFYKFN